MRRAGKSGASPEVIATTIHDALTTDKPKDRYAGGGGAGLLSAIGC